MKTISQVIRLLALAMLTSLTSTAFAGPADFSICGGSTGVAKGLCRAGIAVGCDQNVSSACQKIGEQYTAKTGNEPPWSDRTILIFAESTVLTGEKQPLDGTWETSCNPYFETDEIERYIFLGDTFERQEIVYTSTDGSCSAGGETATTHLGTIAAFDDFTTLGWKTCNDIECFYDAPLRLDGLGSLDPNPTVTKLVITIPEGSPGTGIYHIIYYMDDTVELGCLYEGVETDPGIYSNWVYPEIPRCKQ